MEMDPAVTTSTAPVYVTRDITPLVVPYAIDIVPQEDSELSGEVEEDDEKDLLSRPKDDKANDKTPLTFRKKWGTAIIITCIGCCFLAAYVLLVILAVIQVRSASNAPKSHLGGYSTSDYGWDVTSFRNVDFVSQPRALSGRYSNGKNVKTTSIFRLEVSFNSITPQDSGGEVSLTLKMIVPESWKDESKPPAPWFTVTCQFGNAVISVTPKSNPSDYEQVYPNFRLETGSYNAYPFDAYAADATSWCYYDATAVNADAPQSPTIQPVAVPAPTYAPTVSVCTFVPRNATDPCCTNLYTYNDPIYGTYIENRVLYSNQFHMFGCCSAHSQCCGPASDRGAFASDDDGATGPLSAACVMATTTLDTPSACDVNISTYQRDSCAQSLFYPSTLRRLDQYPVGDGYHVEHDSRRLDTKKYTAVIPTFSPSQGYLNFEIAIENSDSGFFQHKQTYSGVKVITQTDNYYPGGGQSSIPVIYDVITFPNVAFIFFRAPINKVFAVYIMIALWMIVASQSVVNFTFYTGLRKVDTASIVTGAVTILFALPAVRNTMPGVPPLGAVMDFAVYFWCIIISIMHILYISTLWMDLTYINPIKVEEKPQKVIVVEDPAAAGSSTKKKSASKNQ